MLRFNAPSQFSQALKLKEYISLDTFRNPPLLQVSRQVRAESIGLLTTLHTIDLTIRTDYIQNEDRPPRVLNNHDVGVLHIDPARKKWLIANDSSFRKLRIFVACVCCPSRLIGEIRVVLLENSNRYVVSMIPHPFQVTPRLVALLGVIKERIQAVVDEVGARDGRAAMRFADLEAVAACLR